METDELTAYLNELTQAEADIVAKGGRRHVVYNGCEGYSGFRHRLVEEEIYFYSLAEKITRNEKMFDEKKMLQDGLQRIETLFAKDEASGKMLHGQLKLSMNGSSSPLGDLPEEWQDDILGFVQEQRQSYERMRSFLQTRGLVK